MDLKSGGLKLMNVLYSPICKTSNVIHYVLSSR